MITTNKQPAKPDTHFAKQGTTKGDFAVGERTLPLPPKDGDFATGEHALPTTTAVGDFASGEHKLPATKDTGDFATGEHALPSSPENPSLIRTTPPAVVVAKIKE